jgi:hypothetical protein
VVDVIPPTPPKLLDQVQRILEVAEDLPPMELSPELVDLRDLIRDHPAARYLFPCRGSGVTPEGGMADYLDERPARQDWLLTGCARSREIYRWFYGEEPRALEMCPRRLLTSVEMPTLTRCCLLEKQVRQEGWIVTVPWGTTLSEVRHGLELLVGEIEPAWPVA